MKYFLDNTMSYFASANSFSGFKSNFKTAFNPDKFERIFILKGGPGTGKSTLMKKIGEYFLEKNCEVTRFICSSDPTSLDGVVVSKDDKKIAIIDGTAPHITDPEFPGACEKIINLTEALDYQALKDRKKEISAISRCKRENYAKAYEYLSVAGKVYDSIWGIIEKSDIYTEAESVCNEVLGYELCTQTNAVPMDFCYLSAFGKEGYTRVNIPCIEKEYISVIGDGFTEQTVMRLLKKRLVTDSLALTVSHSPFTNKDTDVITTESCIISTDKLGSIIFDTTPFALSFDHEYPELLTTYKNLLTLSASYFKSAAESHFSLERIYSTNIDFRYNERCIKDIKHEIEQILYS